MRGADIQQLGVFSYASVEDRIPQDHPIRTLRLLVDTVLKELDPVFAERYAPMGRQSIPPERLLRAALLQVIFSVRSERLLMEQMQYNLLFRWFVELNIDDAVWDHSTFSFNRDRLFDEKIAQTFFANTVLLARVGELVSDEHFSVDGTLLEAWASHKSFRPKDGGDGDGRDFRGEERRNDPHASTTDPDARLMRKGAGKGYDTQDFVAALEGTARYQGTYRAQHERAAQCDRRTHGPRQGLCDEPGGAQAHRARVGLVKTFGSLSKLPRVGLERVRGWVAFNFAAYNLIRIGGIGQWWDPSPT
jgi:transposase